MSSNLQGRKKLKNIAFVIDDRLSRDRMGILKRIATAVTHFANVQFFPGIISQETLVQELQKGDFALVLAPWHRYLSWSKIEAFYGLTRTSGPTFAGYIAEPLAPQELGSQKDHYRAILLDFTHSTEFEAAKLLRCLLTDTQRTGIRPLLSTTQTIYCENWFASQGLGNRIDSVLSLPEFSSSEWNQRSSAIRILLGALWSLVYEEGPGKSELIQAASAKTPRASFQLSMDSSTLVMRLCYSMPSWTAKEALAQFWPGSNSPSSASQLLLRFADYLRVHTLSDSTNVEIVAGLFASAPAEKAHHCAHTLWIEPVAQQLVSEAPFEAPSPASPWLRPLPVRLPTAASGISPDDGSSANDLIRDLKQQLTQCNELIRDLKSGGVGTAQSLPPPDAESLLESFQTRYFEARFQIRIFQRQIAEMEKKDVPQAEIEALRKKMSELCANEQEWIAKLAQVIETLRAAKQDGSGE